METKTWDIIVVGGGLGGCLVTMQLLKQHPGAKVCLIEKKTEHLARGIAYAKHFTSQLLNVPVAGMSIHPDEPGHFYNWLTVHQDLYPHLVFDQQTFVPRSIYGDYVEDQFNAATEMAGPRLRVVFGEAVGFGQNENHINVTCKNSETLQARYLVLATGNLPPADILIKNLSFLQSPLYVSNPWTPGVINNLETHKNVLLIGSGLTAIDIVLALYEQRHLGHVFLLSRRGKLPLPHAAASVHQFSQPEALLSGDIKLITQALRKEVKKHEGQDVSWQSIMDSLRPWTQNAWKKLDLGQKKIFLSRLRSFWEIHRHRVPASSLEKIETMKSKGQLVHYKGNLQDVTEIKNTAEVSYIHNNQTRCITVDLVINCTGPESNFRKHNLPLLVDMLKKGQVVSDTLNLGIGCNDEGRVLNEKLEVNKHVFCMGHLRKGTFWETTAVRELREQAKEIAQLIAV